MFCCSLRFLSKWERKENISLYGISFSDGFLTNVLQFVVEMNGNFEEWDGRFVLKFSATIFKDFFLSH